MNIPLTVTNEAKEKYYKNMCTITNHCSRIVLFTYDHRLEHLAYDFYGENVTNNAVDVEHAFFIASKSTITAFVTQFGLIARYGDQFRNIPYLVKLTGKVPIRTFTNDAYNYPLCYVQDVIELQKNSGLQILGVAVTIYLGSIFEEHMIQYASEAIKQAHKQGMIAFLFMYIRGENLNQKDLMLLAGAASIANVLGADFVKLHVPADVRIEDTKKIRSAAGNTRILYAGGDKVETKVLLNRLTFQFENNMCDGVAVGRNLFQREAKEAIVLVDQIRRI